ncbi:protein containing hemopexin repeat [Lunatimonas lonarensis]|uniref:Protein containing hemopexin repeat n=1 Tax=Lunatimonas lonarensis TaxID=1232681 RepID=R7ZRS2_9BACT|nr:alkaline phosphatase family protein [Lunatimonas lonarensis]EON76684.1 protein containing hemopexin repeat [Lunatimonas lonarensis]
MINYRSTLALIGLFLCLSVQNPSHGQIRKTLFIILDGIQRELLEKNPTPSIDEISQKGDYIHAHVGGMRGGYSETPTISAVGYNSLLTGVWYNKHNVRDNSIRQPNYNYWTVFRFLKTAFPHKTTAVYSTWLDNRTKLVGENLPETGHLQLDYHFDGMEIDTLGFPHDNESKYIHEIDKLVAAYAAKDVLEKGPDLSWVYLQYTDDMGHRYGVSEQMNHAIREADKQVGLIWSAIKEREKLYGEEWLLLITTDHGRGEGGFGHGGQSDAERATWIVSSQSLNERAGSIPGVVDLLPTMADFMGIPIPKNQAMEIDGISLLKKPYADRLEGTLEGERLHLKWHDYDSGQKAKVWITTGNQFRFGNSDTYRLVGEVELSAEKVALDLGTIYQNLKVVLELPKGYCNVWVKNIP